MTDSKNLWPSPFLLTQSLLHFGKLPLSFFPHHILYSDACFWEFMVNPCFVTSDYSFVNSISPSFNNCKKDCAALKQHCLWASDNKHSNHLVHTFTSWRSVTNILWRKDWLISVFCDSRVMILSSMTCLSASMMVIRINSDMAWHKVAGQPLCSHCEYCGTVLIVGAM